MDDRIWTTQAPTPGTTLTLRQCTLECLPPQGAALVSGALDRALACLAPGAPLLGLLETQPATGPFALRIARDRALLCTAAPLGQQGWHDGWALSAADDAYVALHVSGPAAADLQAACMAPYQASPSAMVIFAGQYALLSRSTTGFIARVEAAHSAEIAHYLQMVANNI